MSVINLDFRPVGYFWPLSLGSHLLGTVKGAVRQNHIHSLIEQNRLDELSDWLAHESLPDEVRTATGRVHPILMGGEYLPNLHKVEVEIARISLKSVTGDVISVRAARGKRRIRYRIIDEYNGETLSGVTRRTSTRPLTLGQLEKFIEGSSGGMDIVRRNIFVRGGYAEECKGFLHASSPFYPGLTALYQQRFDELVEAERIGSEDDFGERKGAEHA
jgi:hypothetical protein